MPEESVESADLHRRASGHGRGRAGWPTADLPWRWAGRCGSNRHNLQIGGFYGFLVQWLRLTFANTSKPAVARREEVVPTYVVERYVPVGGSVGIAPVLATDRLMAQQMSAAGMAVRYLGAIYVPADEICFSLFEGASIEAVRQASNVAGSAYLRIVEAVDMRETVR